MVEDNHNLIYSFIHSRGLCVEEWYGILAIELCESVIYWNENRGSLATFFYIRGDNAVSLEINKRNFHKRKANEDTLELKLDLLPHETHPHPLVEIMQYGHEDIILMKYKGYTQQEIADKIGVSQKTISNRLSRVLEEYKNGGDNNYK